MGDVKDTLAERETMHGDYRDVAKISQFIKMALKDVCDVGSLSYAQRESLDLIATKMARIVSGDPENIECMIDHWLDIEGYARLVRNILEEK